MLRTGDLVPHFEVTRVSGESISYSTLWQRKSLVLLVLPHVDSESVFRCISELTVRQPEFNSRGAELIITRERIPSMSGPGVLIADRWGEIAHVSTASDVADLPSAAELLDWLEYVEKRCPECEGEAK